jgi:hypothetical protein
MGNQQLMQMKSLFASIKERISNPNVDLATARDIVESLHLATAEAEGVTYISCQSAIRSPGYPTRSSRRPLMSRWAGRQTGVGIRD